MRRAHVNRTPDAALQKAVCRNASSRRASLILGLNTARSTLNCRGLPRDKALIVAFCRGKRSRRLAKTLKIGWFSCAGEPGLAGLTPRGPLRAPRDPARHDRRAPYAIAMPSSTHRGQARLVMRHIVGAHDSTSSGGSIRAKPRGRVRRPALEHPHPTVDPVL